MKKTSPSQFDMMVTFMEEHGDLAKPTANARGRVRALNKWEELASILNSDGTGDTKPVEKWKKAWSDLKNNTKKKAARLHQAASRTGGGPASSSRLTDVEQRVLAIIGFQAATGVADVVEAGLSQNIPNSNIEEEIRITSPPAAPTNSPPRASASTLSFNIFSSPPRPRTPPTPNTPNTNESTEIWNLPGPSRLAHVAPPQTPAPNLQETARSHEPGASPQAARSSTPRPRQPVRPRLTPRARASPRRRARRTQSIADQAAQNFLNSDSEWRKFKIEQHRAHVELEREKNRLRELEVEVHRGWQNIASKCIDVLDKLANKFLMD